LYSVINRLLTKINFEMKKLSLLLAGVALVAFSFTSCKKDYTCTCAFTYGDYSYDYSYELLKMKKGDAEDTCTEWSDYYLAYGYEGECTLD